MFISKFLAKYKVWFVITGLVTLTLGSAWTGKKVSDAIWLAKENRALKDMTALRDDLASKLAKIGARHAQDTADLRTIQTKLNREAARHAIHIANTGCKLSARSVQLWNAANKGIMPVGSGAPAATQPSPAATQEQK